MKSNNNKCCAILFLKGFKKKSASSTTPSICYIRLDEESSAELHQVKNAEKAKNQLHEQERTMIAKPLQPILKRSCLIEMLYLSTLQKPSMEDREDVTETSSMIRLSIHYKQLLDRPFLFLSHILNNDETNVNLLKTYSHPENVYQENTCFCNGNDLLRDASKKEFQSPHCFQKETWMAFFQLITTGGPSTVIEKPHYVYENNSEVLFRLLDDLLHDGHKFMSNKLKETSQSNLAFTLQQNTQVWKWSATVMLYFILQDISYCREKWENFDKTNTICVAIHLNWQLIQIIICHFVNPLNTSYKNVHNAIAFGIKTAQYFFMLDWIAKEPHFVYNRLKQQLCDLETLLLQAVKELEQERPEVCSYQFDETKHKFECTQLKPEKYPSVDQSQGHFFNTGKELQALLTQVEQRLNASPFNWNKALAGKVLLLAFLLDSTCGVLTALTYIMSVTTSPFNECPELSWIFGDLSRDVQLYFFQLRLARHLSLFVIQEAVPHCYLTENHSLHKMNTFRVGEEPNRDNASDNSNRNIIHHVKGPVAHPRSIARITTFHPNSFTSINDLPQYNTPVESFNNTTSNQPKAFDLTNECQEFSIQAETNRIPLLSSRGQPSETVRSCKALMVNDFIKENHQDGLRKKIERRKIFDENELDKQQHNSKHVSTVPLINFKLLEQKINKLELELYKNRSFQKEKEIELECPKIVRKKCPTKHHVPYGAHGTFTKVQASTPPPSLSIEKNMNQSTTPLPHSIAYNESIYQKLKSYELKVQKVVESLERRVSQYGSVPEHEFTTTLSKDEPEPVQKRKQDVFRKQTASLRSFLAQKAHVERFRKDNSDLLSSDVSQLKKNPAVKTFKQDFERETKREIGSKTFRKNTAGENLTVKPQPLICNKKNFQISGKEFDNEMSKTQHQNNYGSSSSNKPQLNIFFKNLGIKMLNIEHILPCTSNNSNNCCVKSPAFETQPGSHNEVSAQQDYHLKQICMEEKHSATNYEKEKTNLAVTPERITINRLKEKRKQHETEKVNMDQKENVNITNVHIPKKLIFKERNGKDRTTCTGLSNHHEIVCVATAENFSDTSPKNVLLTTIENTSSTNKENFLPRKTENVELTKTKNVSPKARKDILSKKTTGFPTNKVVDVLYTDPKSISSTDLKNICETNKQCEIESDIEVSSKNHQVCFTQKSKTIKGLSLKDNMMVENLRKTTLLKAKQVDSATDGPCGELTKANDILTVDSAKGKLTADKQEKKREDALIKNHIAVTDEVLDSESSSLVDGGVWINNPLVKQERTSTVRQESFSDKMCMAETDESATKTNYYTETVEEKSNCYHGNNEKKNFNTIGQEKIMDEKNNGKKILKIKKSCMPIKCDCRSKLLSSKDKRNFKGLPLDRLTKKSLVVKTGATIFEASEKKALTKSVTCCVKSKSLLKAKINGVKNCPEKSTSDLPKTISRGKNCLHNTVLKRRNHWVPAMTPEEEASRIEALRLKRSEKIRKNSAFYLNRYLKQVDALHKITNFSEKTNILFISADNLKKSKSHSKPKSRIVFNAESTDGMIQKKLTFDSPKSEEEQISFHNLFKNEDDAFDMYIEKNSFL